MKKIYFLLGLFILLSSCATADYEEMHYQSKPGISQVNLEQLKSNPDFRKIIKGLQAEKYFDLGKSSKRIETVDYTIDTDNINQIVKENYTSFTFKIIKKNPLPHIVENLVIEKKEDTIRGFLIRYKYTQNYIDQLEKGIQLPFDFTVQRTSYEYKLDDLMVYVNTGL